MSLKCTLNNKKTIRDFDIYLRMGVCRVISLGLFVELYFTNSTYFFS